MRFKIDSIIRTSGEVVLSRGEEGEEGEDDIVIWQLLKFLAQDMKRIQHVRPLTMCLTARGNKTQFRCLTTRSKRTAAPPLS
jgi:hypothetical protein